MPVALSLELYFLAISCVTAYVGLQHLRAYWTWAQVPESELNLTLHKRFVAIQMWCSIIFLCAFLPALAIGIYHTYREPGLLSLLPIPLYFLPTIILRPARQIERDLRNLSASDPATQKELEHITHVWKHRLLPRF